MKAITALSYDYSPYRSQADQEIPAFEIFNEEGDKVADTNEDQPAEYQERVAALFVASPELLEALEFFYNISHDLPSSIAKGYIKLAQEKARSALDHARISRNHHTQKEEDTL